MGCVDFKSSVEGQYLTQNETRLDLNDTAKTMLLTAIKRTEAGNVNSLGSNMRTASGTIDCTINDNDNTLNIFKNLIQNDGEVQQALRDAGFDPQTVLNSL
jgi:hypothetical protein